MKNIYNKLKPEIRKSIKKDLELFPVTTDRLIDSLELHSFWSDLKVHDVNRIISFTHLSFVEISINDILWGDNFLLNEGN